MIGRASEVEGAHAGEGTGTEDPRAMAAGVERLLGDVKAMVSPVAWTRIEELVARLVALYGSALGRMLELVEEGRGLDEKLRAGVCGDELLSGLFAMHGLHPSPALERVQKAVASVRHRLGAGAGTVEITVDETQVAHLVLSGKWSQVTPRETVIASLREAVEAEAPDLAGVEIGGVDWSPAPKAGLVQLDLARSHARTEETGTGEPGR